LTYPVASNSTTQRPGGGGEYVSHKKKKAKERDADIVVGGRQIKDEMIRGFCTLTEVVIMGVVASVLVVGTLSSRLNPTIMTTTEMITDTATNPNDTRPILTNFLHFIDLAGSASFVPLPQPSSTPSLLLLLSLYLGWVGEGVVVIVIGTALANGIVRAAASALLSTLRGT
jgi:hypothetical protein